MGPHHPTQGPSHPGGGPGLRIPATAHRLEVGSSSGLGRCRRTPASLSQRSRGLACKPSLRCVWGYRTYSLAESSCWSAVLPTRFPFDLCGHLPMHSGFVGKAPVPSMLQPYVATSWSNLCGAWCGLFLCHRTLQERSCSASSMKGKEFELRNLLAF